MRHPEPSSSHELVRLYLLRFQRHQYAIQNAGSVVAPGVDGHRPADLPEAGALVNMALQAEQRLRALQYLPDRPARDPDHLRLACRALDGEGLGEPGCLI